MKTSYDFSFLTSPRDPRLDNWIGQPFVLSYLNSEQGTSYPFRFRPYGATDGHMEHRIKRAERLPVDGTAIQSTPLAAKSTDELLGMVQGKMLVSERWILNGIKSRAFEATMRETLAMLDVFRFWEKEEKDADTLEGLKDALRANEEHTNFVLDYYNIRGERRKDIQSTMQFIHDRFGDREELDSVVSYYEMVNLVKPELDTIIIGKLINGYSEQYWC